MDSKSGCMVIPATMNAMVPRRRSRPVLLPLLAAWIALSACAPPARPSTPPPLVVSDRGGAMRIFELGERDATARLVGSARADDQSYADTLPVRLPDGRIAFVSDRGGRRSIYLTSSGSAAASPLLPSGASPGDDSDPAPLGADHLVFARAAAAAGNAADAAPAARDLWSVALDGSGLRLLTHDAADDGEPCALADGRTIVFVTLRRGAPRLFRLDATAPDPEATIAPLFGAADAADDAPACLPDGSVLFARSDGARPPQIFHLAPAAGGSGARQVTDASILPAGASEPVSMPDGTLLLTAGPGKGPDGRPRCALYRIAEGGYNLVRLTREQAGYNDYARLLDTNCR
jgi:Tol biopolymer transport system component